MAIIGRHKFKVQTLAVTSLILAATLSLSACAPESEDLDAPKIKAGSSSLEQAEHQKKPATQNSNQADKENKSGSFEESDNALADKSSDPKNQEAPPQLSEENIPGRTDSVPTPRVKDLPTDFPAALIPHGFEGNIFDVGSRGSGSWFLILQFDELGEANQAVEKIAEKSDWKEHHKEAQPDGSVEWEFSSSEYSVNVINIEDGKGLVFTNFEFEPAL